MISGGAGDDTLNGDQNRDSLNGSDVLRGSAGNGTLPGDSVQDTLIGWRGSSVCGNGRDTGSN